MFPRVRRRRGRWSRRGKLVALTNPALSRNHFDVAIVGAGAAGLATAIFAGRRARAARIVLLDGARRPGAKILVSGGGRCNVTNTVVSDDDFWGGRRPVVRRVLRAFPAPHAAAFFREIGLPLHEEEDGKLFPDSNRARDVLDVLLRELAAVGATLRAEHRVLDIVPHADGFAITTAAGDCTARCIVLATGGLSLPKSGSDGAGLSIAERLGHTIVSTTPALTPLLLAPDDQLHKRARWRRACCGAVDLDERTHHDEASWFDALDALRAQRTGRVERVAPLASARDRWPAAARDVEYVRR